MIPRTSPWLLALVLAIPAVAPPWCAPALAADVSRARITGSATYRERVALPPTAVFEATLEDVSRADAPAEVIARVRKNAGQVPIAFEIPYDPRRIDARKSYVVRAGIYEDGRLRFSGSRAVLTQGNGNRIMVLMSGASGDGRAPDQLRDRREPVSAVGTLPAMFVGLLPCADCAGIRYQINLLPGGAYMQRMTYLRDGHDDSYYELGTWSLSSDGRILRLDGGREGDVAWLVEDSRTLRKLDREGKPVDSQRSYELTRRARIEPLEPRVQLTGMFRYMADAARFRDCRSGLQWPVSMSDDYLALERAYAGRRTPPGSELLVSLMGRIEERPKMDGEGTEPTLLVERFVRAMPGEKCQERTSRAGLENSRWRPVLIGDRPVIVSGQQREPWIVLDPRSKRATGSGGCNRFSGSYHVGNGTLRFGPLLATKMACPLMDTEVAFFRALEETRRYRVLGRTLELLDDRGGVLARLEERNL